MDRLKSKLSVFVVLFLSFGIVFLLSNPQTALGIFGFGENKTKNKLIQVERRIDYGQNKLEMQEVVSKIEKGQISISLNDVKKKKFVFFEYRKDGVNVPLLAYIAPSGKLVVGVRMCEPCRSQAFHILKDILVCNTCGTRWTLQEHRGLSGGCMKYPPEHLPYKVSKGRVFIAEKAVRDWKPRAL